LSVLAEEPEYLMKVSYHLLSKKYYFEKKIIKRYLLQKNIIIKEFIMFVYVKVKRFDLDLNNKIK
jgi:hypothetical protein